MKILLVLALILGNLVSILNADEFTVKYNNLQSIDKIICLDSKLHIIVEIDDVKQPLQIFKTERDEFGNNIPVLCENKNQKGKINEK